MFDVSCDTMLPVEYVEIQSISVRGELGPLTVWQTPNTFQGKHEEMEEWTKVYDATHPPSREMTELVLDPPLRLRPGESLGLYVHSALPGDEAIVYDNQRNHTTYRDRVFKVLPGLAHLSNRPFGKRGFWGRPWRTNREFVGKVLYGVRWRMWSPNSHHDFPVGFKEAVMTMLMGCRHRPDSLLYLLQDEIVFFIMNKCMWDCWGDEICNARCARRVECGAPPICARTIALRSRRRGARRRRRGAVCRDERAAAVPPASTPGQLPRTTSTSQLAATTRSRWAAPTPAATRTCSRSSRSSWEAASPSRRTTTTTMRTTTTSTLTRRRRRTTTAATRRDLGARGGGGRGGGGGGRGGEGGASAAPLGDLE